MKRQPLPAIAVVLGVTACLTVSCVTVSKAVAACPEGKSAPHATKTKVPAKHRVHTATPTLAGGLKGHRMPKVSEERPSRYSYERHYGYLDEAPRPQDQHEARGERRFHQQIVVQTQDWDSGWQEDDRYMSGPSGWVQVPASPCLAHGVRCQGQMRVLSSGEVRAYGPPPAPVYPEVVVIDRLSDSAFSSGGVGPAPGFESVQGGSRVFVYSSGRSYASAGARAYAGVGVHGRGGGSRGCGCGH